MEVAFPICIDGNDGKLCACSSAITEANETAA
jgi:hypothetical protein